MAHATTIPQIDQDHPDRRLSFFDLPHEIRDKVYRFLYLDDRPLDVSGYYAIPRDVAREGFSKVGRLSPHVLRVCRQLFAEASIVLYEKNTFALRFFSGGGVVRARDSELKIKWLAVDAWNASEIPTQMKRIRKYHVVVDMNRNHRYSQVSPSVRRTCLKLAQAPKLMRINVFLKIHPEVQRRSPGAHRILKPFKILRNVHLVTFDDPFEVAVPGSTVPQEYAQALKSVMEGPPLPEPLPQMYCALQEYTLFSEHYLSTLSAAFDTMQDGDCEEFNRVAQQLTKEVETRMASAQAKYLKSSGNALKQP